MKLWDEEKLHIWIETDQTEAVEYVLYLYVYVLYACECMFVYNINKKVLYFKLCIVHIIPLSEVGFLSLYSRPHCFIICGCRVLYFG